MSRTGDKVVSEIDWSNDEAVVRAALPNELRLMPDASGMPSADDCVEMRIKAPAPFRDVWVQVGAYSSTVKGAWENARKHKDVVAFEAQHRPASLLKAVRDYTCSACKAEFTACTEPRHPMCPYCGGDGIEEEERVSQPLAAEPRELNMDEPLELFICAWKDDDKHCIYLNDHRIAGGKPWGGGETSKAFKKVTLRDIARALPSLQSALNVDYLGNPVASIKPEAPEGAKVTDLQRELTEAVELMTGLTRFLFEIRATEAEQTEQRRKRELIEIWIDRNKKRIKAAK